MASKRFLVGLVAALAGCGPSTMKPDPPMDEAKQRELTLKSLESDDPVQRGLAASALGLAGSKSKEHLEAIKKLQNDPDPIVRERAMEAIQRIEKEK